MTILSLHLNLVKSKIAKLMGQTWAHMGPVCPRRAHVGPMNLVSRDVLKDTTCQTWCFNALSATHASVSIASTSTEDDWCHCLHVKLPHTRNRSFEKLHFALELRFHKADMHCVSEYSAFISESWQHYQHEAIASTKHIFSCFQ